MRLGKGKSFLLAFTGSLVIGFSLVSLAHAQTWTDVGTTSGTLTSGYMCNTDGTNILCNTPNPYVSSAGWVGVGTATPASQMAIVGNVSSASWTTTGLNLSVAAATLTDTSSLAAATVSIRAAQSLDIPTLASTNAITVTAAANLYIAGAPAAGANTTLTASYPIYVASGISYMGTGIRFVSAAGNGIGFWAGAPTTYGIFMSNSATYQYGDVNDYYIANVMSSGTGRGFTWSYGAVPSMALNASSGNLAIKGTLTVNGTGSSTVAGPLTATALIPSGSTVPANGMYLPAANTLAFATNTGEAMRLTSTKNMMMQASAYINWGSTEGSTGYGFRDNAGTMEYKNSSGSWLPFIQTTNFPAGTVSVPGLYVSTDTDTGFFQATTNTLSIGAGGVEVARFNTTASAVNYFTLAPSIDTAGAGSTLTLSAAGTSTTIPITIDAKGTSSITLADATTVSGTLTANSFIPTSSTIPTNGMYLPAANTLGFGINSAAEMQLTASALVPAVSDGLALGTTALMWSDLFLASGSTINFNNGDVTLTHSTDTLTLGGGNLVVTGVATTGDNLSVTGGSITTGTVANLSSASTAGGASGVSKVLSISRSGANANTAHTAYGVYSTVTNTNATSGTNVAGYFSASGATTANYGLIVAAGKVAIGTTSNQANVDIYSSSAGATVDALVLSNPNQASVNTAVALHFDPNGAGSLARTAKIISRQTTSGNYADLGFFTAAGATPAERLTIMAAGNVGVGTTTANHLLDVYGNIGVKTSGYINFSTTDGSGGYGIRDNAGAVEYKNSGGAWTGLGVANSFPAGSAAAPGLYVVGDTNTGFFQATADTLSITTNGTESARFTDDNRFALGTTTASSQLTIYGSLSNASWTTTGLNFSVAAATLTDTSSLAAATISTVRASNSFAVPTYASTNAITVTSAANVYIAGAPAAGTNTTITNSYPLYVAAGRSLFGGGLQINGRVTSNATLATTVLPTQGAYIGWNETNGTGKTYFMNQKGSGTGGFEFALFDNAGAYVSSPFIIDSTGYVGIGTATPAYLLDVYGQKTNTSGTIRNVSHVQSVAAASNSSATFNNVYNYSETTGAVNYTGTIYGTIQYYYHQGSGTVGSVVGFDSNVYNNSTGTITNGYATNNQLYIQNTGGSITNAYGSYNALTNSQATGTGASVAYGSYNLISNVTGGTITTGSGALGYISNSGTMTTARGLHAYLNNGSTGAITTGYSLFVDTANAGTITTWYGVYVDPVSGAGTMTNRYPLYIGDTGTSYIAGNLGVGTNAPDAKLTVVAANATTPQIRLRGTRAAIVATNVIGGIEFMSNDTELTAPGTVTASIQALANVSHTAAALGTDIVLYTTTGTTYSEALRITGANNVRHVASSYINFGSTEGSSGYGIRDNAGAIEYKNNGGSWTGMGTSNIFAAGTVSAPGLAVSTDTDTGLYQATANTLSITAGGTEVARFNTTASAVNYFTLAPSIDTAGAGSTLTLSAAGTSTTIPITIDAKGTSSITLADATTVSGTLTANSFIPTSSTIPTNGMFLPAANTVGFATNSGEAMRITSANNIAINTTTAGSLLTIGGAVSQSSWTTTGAAFSVTAATYTDTSSAAAATVATRAAESFGTPTYASTNAITITNAANVYISNAPTAGTNVTITNPWALYVASGKSYFASEVIGAGTSAGQFRMANATYGTILRNDDSNWYFLITNSGDPYGSWSTQHPITIGLSSGNVAIGTNNPAYQLTVAETKTDTASGNRFMQSNTLTLSPASASSGSFHALFSQVDTTGSTVNISAAFGSRSLATHGGTGTLTTGYGAFNDSYVTSAGGVMSNAYGAYNRAYTNSTVAGSIGTAYGSYNVALNNAASPSSIARAYGASGVVQNAGTGTITSAYATYANLYNSSTGTITTGYSLFVDTSNSNGGTIANWYGIYVDAVSGTAPTTTRYPIFVADTGTSYMAGGLRFAASNYINFGTTAGTGGYGIFDSAGTLQYKNSGGSWTAFGVANNFAAGSAASPGFYVTGDTNTGLFQATADTLSFSAAGVEAMRINALGYLGINSASPPSLLNIAGTVSDSSWTTSGKLFSVNTTTLTDTSSAAAATVTTRAASSFGTPTLASTNAITVTNAANVYINGAPGAGTNTTITNPYALYVNSGNSRFGGEVISVAATSFRTVFGNYGSFIYNNGSNTYFMLTDSGDQYGSFNSLRPLFFSNSTGMVFMNQGLTMGNAASNTIYFGNNGTAVPGASSVGEKIQLYGTAGTVGASDYALGIESGNMWLNSGGGFKWYVASNLQMVLNSSGQLGVGGAPSYQLHVTETKTNTTGTQYMQYNALTITPASASSASFTSTYSAADSTGSTFSLSTLRGAYNLAQHGGTSTVTSLQGALNDAYVASGAGAASNVYGAYNRAFTNSTTAASIGTAYGSYNTALNNAASPSSIARAYGTYGIVSNANTGTITSAYATYANLSNGSTGTITTGYSLFVDTANSGTLTNWYGIYVDAVSGTAPATTRYPIFVADTGTSYMAGGLRFAASNYINFGTTAGTGGYGIFDSAGTLQYKNSGGSWTAFGVANNFAAGSAATPGFYVTGDPNTGLFQATADTLSFSTGGTEAMRVTADNRLAIGTSTASSQLTVYGAISNSSWTTTGLNFSVAAATLTDTSSAAAATVATRTGESFGRPTFASTNAITVTNAANVYIAGTPIAGTNTTITNAYALYVAGGDSYFAGDVYANGTTYWGDGKNAIQYSDAWLRFNQTGDFTNGIYMGSSIVRTDGSIQVGASGAYLNATTTAFTVSVPSTVTSTLTANSFIPSSSTIPTNGMFLPAANTVGFATNSGEAMRITSANNIAINTTTAGSLLTIGGAVSQASWTTTGAAFSVSAATYTDTSSAAAATVATRSMASYARPTYASTNAMTVTDASTIYIANSPLAGTNTTLTNTWALYVAAGNTYFGAPVTFGSSTTHNGTASFAAITASSTVTANSFIPTSSTIPTNGMFLPAANTVGFATNSGEAMRITSANNIAINTTTAGSLLTIGGAVSQSSWTTTGSAFSTTAATYTDTSSAASATIATRVATSYGVPTFAASNLLTGVTKAANVYIAGAPAVGTNLSAIGMAYGLYVAGGYSYFGGNGVITANLAFPDTGTLEIGPVTVPTSPTAAPPGAPSAISISTTAVTVNYASTFAATLSLSTGIPIQFASGTGDKIYMHSNTYGIGVESSTVTIWSPTTFRWRLGGTSATTGTSTVTFDSGGVNAPGFASSGAISQSSWTTTGPAHTAAIATYTDTSSAAAATVATRVANSFLRPTFASTNAITVTDASTLYIQNSPAAGTNTTVTNAWAIHVAAGASKFGGNVTFASTLTASSSLTAATAGQYLCIDTAGAYAITRGNTCSLSDARLKKNITELSGALEKLSGVRGVAFEWKNEKRGKGRQIGLIAQEVEKVYPEAVTTNGDADGFKGLNYDALVGPIIEAIRELNDLVKKNYADLVGGQDNLREENKALQARLDDMSKKYDALEARLNKLADDKKPVTPISYTVH